MWLWGLITGAWWDVWIIAKAVWPVALVVVLAIGFLVWFCWDALHTHRWKR